MELDSVDVVPSAVVVSDSSSVIVSGSFEGVSSTTGASIVSDTTVSSGMAKAVWFLAIENTPNMARANAKNVSIICFCHFFHPTQNKPAFGRSMSRL